jgi:hypothetical protein
VQRVPLDVSHSFAKAYVMLRYRCLRAYASSLQNVEQRQRLQWSISSVCVPAHSIFGGLHAPQPIGCYAAYRSSTTAATSPQSSALGSTPKAVFTTLSVACGRCRASAKQIQNVSSHSLWVPRVIPRQLRSDSQCSRPAAGLFLPYPGTRPAVNGATCVSRCWHAWRVDGHGRRHDHQPPPAAS